MYMCINLERLVENWELERDFNILSNKSQIDNIPFWYKARHLTSLCASIEFSIYVKEYILLMIFSKAALSFLYSLLAHAYFMYPECKEKLEIYNFKSYY